MERNPPEERGQPVDPLADIREDIRSLKASVDALKTQLQSVEARMNHLYTAAVFPDRRGPGTPGNSMGMPPY